MNTLLIKRLPLRNDVNSLMLTAWKINLWIHFCRKLQPQIFCTEHPDAPLVEDYHAGDMICPECGLVVGDRFLLYIYVEVIILFHMFRFPSFFDNFQQKLYNQRCKIKYSGASVIRTLTFPSPIVLIGEASGY